MLFRNEKPKHINYAMIEFSKKLPIVDEVNEGNNEDPSVFKSINLSRKIKLKPISNHYIINNEESDFILPKIGSRSSIKDIKILSQNIFDETEKEVQKKLLKTCFRDPKKNIKININIENININKNTIFLKDEEKSNRDKKHKTSKVDLSKLIKIVNDYNQQKTKKFIKDIIKNLRSNKNYTIIISFLKQHNIENNPLKFLNNILCFKSSLNKKAFDKMIKLIKFYVFSLKLTKRIFVKKLKGINQIFIEKQYQYAVYIQKVYGGFSYRKKNKAINEINKKRKAAIIKIQKRSRGVISRKKNFEFMNSFREFKRIQQMKRDYLIQRKLVLRQVEAVRVIENFWSAILEKRDDEKLDQQIANMPEECKNLYKKFVNLRKQTNNLKKDLVKIGMKK